MYASFKYTVHKEIFQILFRFAVTQLEKLANQQETISIIQSKNCEMEKTIAMLKHDLKECQRKYDNECENRKKAEAKVQELWTRIEHDQNLRAQLSVSSQQMNDKVSNLEKQIHELNEKIKIESENTLKFKKANTELLLVG